MVKKPRNMAMQRQISPDWKRPVLLNAFRVNCNFQLIYNIAAGGKIRRPSCSLSLCLRIIYLQETSPK